jgi:hypothetical protein
LFQIDFDDPALQRPFKLLLECLEEDNLKKLDTIWNMNKISEKQLLVGVGVHLIKKLTGEAYTTEDRACEVCPCGCGGKLDTTAMCIGKLVLHNMYFTNVAYKTETAQVSFCGDSEFSINL